METQPASRGPAVRERTDVLIIGGGLAGLNALRELSRRGVDAALVEAQDRLGGRVESITAEDGGGVIELGAQFVARGQRRLRRLIADAGQSVHWLGPEARAAEDKPRWWVGWDLAQARLRLAALHAWHRTRPPGAWRARTIAALAGELCFGEDAARRLAAEVADDFCLAPSEISLAELSDQVRSMGGLRAVASADGGWTGVGLSSVVDLLAAGSGPRIQRSSPVHAVRRDAAGFLVETGRATWRARALVFAIPPPLFAHIDAAGVLPAERLRTFAAYVRGRVVKTVLVFARPWWRERGLPRFVSPGARFSGLADATLPGQSTGMLVVFTTGAAADAWVAEQPAEAGRIDTLLATLRAATGGPVPTPVAARSVDWSRRPYACGGYAARPGIGLAGDASAHFTPLPGIFFAGTETANVWRSYMEGALQSGERAARQVGKTLGIAWTPSPGGS